MYLYIHEYNNYTHFILNNNYIHIHTIYIQLDIYNNIIYVYI